MPTTINDELTRIEGAKADIATAIGGKGVTVPANAKIDDFADLINAIQTGGGSSAYYDFIKGLFENTLTDVVVPDGVTSMRDHALRGLVSMKTLTISDTVESLGNYCAYQDTNLETFNGGSGLTTLWGYCFSGCSNLATVNLKSVETLKAYVFNDCYSITSIVLPDNINRIEGYSFRNTNLTTLVINATQPPTLTGTSWIQDTPIYSGTGKIYVPYGCGNTYKTYTNWSALANQIYELDENGNIPT